jgi:RluA family pseudouridine synthase
VPLTKEEQTDARYIEGKSCPYCAKTAEEEMAAIIAKRHEAIRHATTPLPGSVPYDKFRPINVPKTCNGASLLEVLCQVVRHVPQSKWEEECATGMILDSKGSIAEASRQVWTGERFLHKFANVVEPKVNASIEVLHEDEALIVLNKPAPLPMHAGGRFDRNTLQYILNKVYHPEKPKQAHRLDANTTGVVLLTRTRHYAGLLQPQFERGEVEKTYLIRIQGHPETDSFSCDAPISCEAGEVGTRKVELEGGLPSRTDFIVLSRNSDGTALLAGRPVTGRTNQIRVHLWHLGFPVCGDSVYLPEKRFGNKQTLDPTDLPLCLHSWRIRFTHPLTRKKVEFIAVPPPWAHEFSEPLKARISEFAEARSQFNQD